MECLGDALGSLALHRRGTRLTIPLHSRPRPVTDAVVGVAVLADEVGRRFAGGGVLVVRVDTGTAAHTMSGERCPHLSVFPVSAQEGNLPLDAGHPIPHLVPMNPLLLLRKGVKKAGSQTAYAQSLGISPSYLSDLLNQRRTLSDRLLKKLGVVKETRYKKSLSLEP